MASEITVPTTLRIGGRIVRVVEKPLKNLSGQWDPKTWTITLQTGQGKLERRVTFIHELLHCLEDTFKSQGKLKRAISHGFIEESAKYLYQSLMQFGWVPRISKRRFKYETRLMVSLWPKKK